MAALPNVVFTSYFTVVFLVFLRIGLVVGGCTGPAVFCPNGCTCSTDNTTYGTILKCEHNDWEHVPSILPKYVNKINLRYHAIEKVSQSDFQFCWNVTLLNLANGKLSVLEDNAFRHLTSLEILYLKNNELEFGDYEKVPFGILPPLVFLKILETHYNNWHLTSSYHAYRDDIIQNKTQLQQYSLDGVRGLPLRDGFSSLLSLVSLHLTMAPVNLTDDTFLSLQHIDLKHLKISSAPHIDRMAFSFLHALESLDLSDIIGFDFCNSGIPIHGWFGLQYTKIKKLVLNNITWYYETPGAKSQFPTECMMYLNETHITEFYLNNNGFTSIPTFRDTLPHLEILSASGNDFGIHIPNMFYDDLMHLQNVTSINFGHKFIVPNIPKNIFPNEHFNTDPIYIFIFLPPKIPTLLVSEITTAQMSLAIFGNVNKMKELDMSGIGIQSLPRDKLHMLSKYIQAELRLVNLSGNGMEHIDTVLPFIKNVTIETLDLGYNKLGGVIKEDNNCSLLQQTQALKVKTLVLTDNIIKSLPPNFLAHVTTVEVLKLNKNSISSWPMSNSFSKSLKYLDLSQNLFPFLDIQFRTD